MKRPDALQRIDQNPLRYMCWIVAIAAIVGGIWVVTPFLELANPGGPSAILEVSTSAVGLYLLGGLAVTSGVMMIVGLLQHNDGLLTKGLFLNIILRIYTFSISTLVYGLTGGSITSMTVLLMIIILYMSFKVRRRVV